MGLPRWQEQQNSIKRRMSALFNRWLVRKYTLTVSPAVICRYQRTCNSPGIAYFYRGFKNCNMKKLLLCASALLCTALGYAQTADEIIEKYVKASGGREKYKGITSIRTTNISKGMGMDISTVSTQTSNGSQRSETSIMGMTSIQAYDAKTNTGWYISPFGGDKSVHKMNEEQTKSITENPRLEPTLMIYKELNATADYLGKEDFEGVDVHLIMVTMPSKSISYYYIDAETFMILKVKSKEKFQDKEYESEVYYADYRPENGIMMAHTTEGYNDGKVTWQSRTEKVEFNVPVDETMFTMPKEEKKDGK
jgi:hypothetical protein